MNSLDIRQDECGLDFVALGAVVQRLDPGITPLRGARSFDVHVSGGEYNVSANLATCFGLKAGVVTASINNDIGQLIESRIREMGVRAHLKRFTHDGVRGPNIAIVYSDRGYGVRGPNVLYNRSNEAAALLKPGDFDWESIFADGVRWFHSGGIFATLSESTGELIIEGMKAAKRVGAICSFDLNYRPKLWAALSGGVATGQQLLRRIVSLVDVLVGVGTEDYEFGFGIERTPPGDFRQVSTTRSDLDDFEWMVHRIRREFPTIKGVATTRRRVISSCQHDWKALLWLDGISYGTLTSRLDIIDRIGGGDGFTAGLFYGLLTGQAPIDALNLGWAHGALVTTFPGDVSMAQLSEVEALARGESATVRR